MFGFFLFVFFLQKHSAIDLCKAGKYKLLFPFSYLRTVKLGAAC